jgi:hypothetical protein
MDTQHKLKAGLIKIMKHHVLPLLDSIWTVSLIVLPRFGVLLAKMTVLCILLKQLLLQLGLVKKTVCSKAVKLALMYFLLKLKHVQYVNQLLFFKMNSVLLVTHLVKIVKELLIPAYPVNKASIFLTVLVSNALMVV